jgi:hypothetical protein
MENDLTNSHHNVDTMISYLGAMRSDKRIETFIRQFFLPPLITVDKVDDADDEFIEFKPHGFGLTFDKGILKSFHLHSGGPDDEYARYGLPLPKGIKFEHSKSDLLAILPPPTVEGGGCDDDFFGYIPDWIRYDCVDGHSVHVEFTSGGQSIRIVTVMLLRKEG